MRCNNLKLYPAVMYTVLNVYKSTINIKRLSAKHASKLVTFDLKLLDAITKATKLIFVGISKYFLRRKELSSLSSGGDNSGAKLFALL